MNLSTVKWAQWDRTQSRELFGLFICVCVALCTIVVHNIAQNRADNFPSYPSAFCCTLNLYQWNFHGSTSHRRSQNQIFVGSWPPDSHGIGAYVVWTVGKRPKNYGDYRASKELNPTLSALPTFELFQKLRSIKHIVTTTLATSHD